MRGTGLILIREEMALLRYLKPIDGLPDPRSSLSSRIPSVAIQEANEEVRQAQASQKKKRGPYKQYSPKLCLGIGKYACQHGVSAAARYFSRKLGSKVSETTVRSIRDTYKDEVKRTERNGSEEERLCELRQRKRGRPLLLGQHIDEMVQLYIRKVREGGGAISSIIVMAAARGILRKVNPSMLIENGGHVNFNRYWARSMLQRMNFVQRKVSTAKSKHTTVNFAEIKKQFLSDFYATVTMEEILPELIMNWDQTGIKLVPCSSWTMDERGVKRVEMVGANDKRQITAVLCGTILGDFLPVQLVYKGKTDRCHPHFQFPADWHIAHSPNHWSTEGTMLQYIDHIIVPYVTSVRDRLGVDSAALVVIDNFKGQVTGAISELLQDNNIHVCLLPPNTTDLLQPMDIAVNKPVKAYLKNQFEAWYSEQVMKQLDAARDMDDLEQADIQPIDMSMQVLKEVGAPWLVKTMEYISENPQFIVNGFVKSGLSAAMDGVFEEEKTTEDKESNTEDDSDFDSD